MKLVDVIATVPPPPPIGEPVSLQAVRDAISGGGNLLPRVYRVAYADPLEQNLPAVFAQLAREEDTTILEAVAGAVYQHQDHPGRSALDRFLAVVSNLYRSFLDQQKRLHADFPLREALPPLTMFQYHADAGPFTLPVDDIARLFGGTVGVVSLPAAYSKDPLLWAALAHETTGHDVLHADESLPPELRRGVRALFAASGEPLLGLLWDYWMDEAASDVYGVVNIGPAFAHNLVILFSLIGAQSSDPRGIVPSLRTQSGPVDRSLALDPHPTDLLRLSLIEGVVSELQGLSQARRQAYIADLRAMTDLCAPDASTIELDGWLRFESGERRFVQGSFPLINMQDAARRVGAFIATTQLPALGAHVIQDLETWDDADEETARRIAELLGEGKSVIAMGDDAQLLAGATLACLRDPSKYGEYTQALEEALDESFERDPIWGMPQADRAFYHSKTAITAPDFYVDPMQQELIEYDSRSAAQAEAAGGTVRAALATVAPLAAVALRQPDMIPWPAGQAPTARKINPEPAADAPLPQCRFVAITWTVDEANAMASVLTPGVVAARSSSDPADLPAWYSYRHNWAMFEHRLRPLSPAAQSQRLGRYYMSRLGQGASAIDVLCFKSELHLSQDGPALPLPDLFKQIIQETEAELVITTGTAGAIGPDLKIGDVVVASQCRFDLLGSFKGRPFNRQTVTSAPVSQGMIDQFTLANQQLLAANAPHLRPQRLSVPRIFWSSDVLGEAPVVVTTHIFAFDDAAIGSGCKVSVPWSKWTMRSWVLPASRCNKPRVNHRHGSRSAMPPTHKWTGQALPWRSRRRQLSTRSTASGRRSPASSPPGL